MKNAHLLAWTLLCGSSWPAGGEIIRGNVTSVDDGLALLKDSSTNISTANLPSDGELITEREDNDSAADDEYDDRYFDDDYGFAAFHGSWRQTVQVGSPQDIRLFLYPWVFLYRYGNLRFLPGHEPGSADRILVSMSLSDTIYSLCFGSWGRPRADTEFSLEIQRGNDRHVLSPGLT